MTKTFTASTGVNVRRYGLKTDRGYALLVDGVRISPNDVQALREYLRDERDRELGRWRDPEYPHIFVRPSCGGKPNRVGVVKDDEAGLAYGQFKRGDYPSLDPMSIVAYRYFAAHPEKKPHPWEDSPAGSVWKIVSAGRGDTLSSGEAT